MKSSHLIKHLKLWLGPFSVCPRLQWRDLQQRADLALGDCWVEINGSILKCLCHQRANHQPNWETLESCCCTVAYARLKYSSVVPGRFNLYHPSLFFIIEQIQVRFTSSIKFGLFLLLFRWISKIIVHITGIANTCFYRSVAYRHAQLESLFILYYL